MKHLTPHPLHTSLLALVCALGIQACASNPVDEREPLDSNIAAVEQPNWVEGTTYKRTNVITGEDESWTIQSIAPNGDVTALSSNGCSWTNQADWFAPSLAWENCGSNPSWSKGSRTINKQTGNLWPLEVGNKVKYSHSFASSTGEKASSVDKCEVLGVVRIDTVHGELDTYKIQCRQSRGSSYQDRTWYWSPEHRDIKYTRIHSRDGVKSHSDGVSLEIPGI